MRALEDAKGRMATIKAENPIKNGYLKARDLDKILETQ